MKRPFQILLSIAVALVALHSSQAAVILTPNAGWERLKWTTTGSPGADRSGVDAGGRFVAWRVADTFRVNDDNDLFSFAVPAGFIGYVDVTDIETNDDGYSVLDFDNSFTPIGNTGGGPGDDLTSIVDDPAITFGSSNWASGSFPVLTDGAGGTFRFKIQRVVGSQVNNGGVFVQVRTEVIPEPSSGLLMLFGLVGLATRRRRA